MCPSILYLIYFVSGMSWRGWCSFGVCVCHWSWGLDGPASSSLFCCSTSWPGSHNCYCHQVCLSVLDYKMICRCTWKRKKKEQSKWVWWMKEQPWKGNKRYDPLCTTPYCKLSTEYHHIIWRIKLSLFIISIWSGLSQIKLLFCLFISSGESLLEVRDSCPVPLWYLGE